MSFYDTRLYSVLLSCVVSTLDSLSLSPTLTLCIRPARAGSRMQQTVHFYVPSSAASPVKHIPIPTVHPMPVMIVDCLSAFLFALP